MPMIKDLFFILYFLFYYCLISINLMSTDDFRYEAELSYVISINSTIPMQSNIILFIPWGTYTTKNIIINEDYGKTL